MSKAPIPKRKKTVVSLFDRAGVFAEDKDAAANLRKTCVVPALKSGETVVLDFAKVEGATQSFVHALIAAAIRSFGAEALDRIEFKSCNPSVMGVIAIVAEYCQLDVGEEEAEQRRPK